MIKTKKYVDIPYDSPLETGTVNSDTNKEDEEIKFLRNRCRVYIDCDNATKLKDFLINLSNIRNDILLLNKIKENFEYINKYIIGNILQLFIVIPEYIYMYNLYIQNKDLYKEVLYEKKKNLLKILYIINFLLKILNSNTYSSIINKYISDLHLEEYSLIINKYISDLNHEKYVIINNFLIDKRNMINHEYINKSINSLILKKEIKEIKEIKKLDKLDKLIEKIKQKKPEEIKQKIENELVKINIVKINIEEIYKEIIEEINKEINDKNKQNKEGINKEINKEIKQKKKEIN